MTSHIGQQKQTWQIKNPAEQANVFTQYAIASAEEAHSIFEQAKTSISPMQIELAEQCLHDALNELHEIRNEVGPYIDSQQLGQLQNKAKMLEEDYKVFQW